MSSNTNASVPVTIAGVDVLLARTGYTGEDGFDDSLYRMLTL